MCNLCDARVAKDISLHPKRNGELPLLPLPVIGALLQAMLWQPPDVALYGALELKLPCLARRVCERDAVLYDGRSQSTGAYKFKQGKYKGLHSDTCLAVKTYWFFILQNIPKIRHSASIQTKPSLWSKRLVRNIFLQALYWLAVEYPSQAQQRGFSPQNNKVAKLYTCREKIPIWKFPLHPMVCVRGLLLLTPRKVQGVAV